MKQPVRVLVTRARSQAEAFAQKLDSIGAQAIFFPTIEIQPVADSCALDQALSNLECYDWLILTSANAVEAVLARRTALGIAQIPGNLKVAAVGPKTAKKLEQAGFPVHFIPPEFTGEAILPGLGDIHRRWCLLPTADLATATLPEAIQANGGFVHVITVYHTRSPRLDPHDLLALQDGLDFLTFTSGSTARNFVTLARENGLDPFALPGNPEVACIGPKTAQVAQELGFQVDLVAGDYTLDGLVTAIETHIRRNQ